MNVDKLKGKFVENGLNVDKVAERLGISRDTLYRRLNNSDSFTIGEATKLKDVLGLSNKEATEIFLP